MSFILALLFNVLKGITVIEILLNATIQAILAVGGVAVFKDIYGSRRLKLREENISEEAQQ